MNEDIIIGIFIGLLIGVVIAGPVGGIIGFSLYDCNATCPSYECKFEDRTATYEILGSNSCEGEKGILFGTDKCTVQIRNTEAEQSATYLADFSCKTVDNSLTKTSNQVTLAPGQVGDLTVRFNEAGNLEWRCHVSNVIGSTVKGCNLVEKH